MAASSVAWAAVVCGRVVDASQHVLVNRQARGIASRRDNAIQCGVGDVSIAYLILNINDPLPTITIGIPIRSMYTYRE